MKAYIVTNFKCNLNCTYCNVNDLYKDTLKLEDIKNLIDVLKNRNFNEIHIIGGEPFLRNDLIEILKYIKKNNIKTIVHSNGFFHKKINKDILEYVDTFHTCINGKEKIHENIRGLKSYDNCIKSLLLIKEYKPNININIDMIFTKENSNKENIDFVLKLVKKNNYKINFQKVFDHKLVSVNKEELKENLNEEESFKKMFSYLKSIYDDKIFLNSYKYIEEHSINNVIKLKKCYNKTIVVNPNGNISFCFDKMENDNYNGLKLGWNKAIEKTLLEDNDCLLCPYSNHVEDSLNVQ